MSLLRLAESLRTELLARTPAKRVPHVMGVEGMSVVLSRRWGLETDRLLVAALLHDLTKPFGRAEQAELLRGVTVVPTSEEDWSIPPIWHGFTAAQEGHDRFGITDGEILRAVAYHSTGTADHEDLGLALYVADATEPSRHWDGVYTMRREALAANDLRTAALIVARAKAQHVADKESPNHSRTREMMTWLEATTNTFESTSRSST